MCVERDNRWHIAKHHRQRNRIDNPNHTAKIKRTPPSPSRRLGYESGTSADDDSSIDCHLVQAHRFGSSRSRMVIDNKRKRSGNVESLTDAHERSHPKQILVARYVASRPRNGRPDKQAPRNLGAAAVSISHVSADGAQQSVDPFKLSEHPSPVGL